jgi:hypothetical protein
MTDTIVCRTERSNPAQSIVALRKFSLKFTFLDNEYLLANKVRGEI